MDHQYINELRALDDKKDAKAKLIEYAELNNIKVKKSKGFDSLVVEIEEGFKALADIPMPENNEGLSIADLIDADNELQGEFVEGDVKEEAKLLFDSPEPAVTTIEVVEPVVEFVEPTPLDIIVAPINRDIEEPEDIPEDVKFTAPVESFELPKNFSPNLLIIGKNPGYCTLPWWIYQWIKDTPDWKSKPTSFEHGSAHQTLFSLIYYINRNGSILIRETRNSSFVTLN